MTTPTFPKIGVGAYVLKNGRVLLGYRSAGHADGSWAAPGGHIEFGESPAEAASREIFEECGLEIPPASWQLRAITNDYFPADNTHYFTLTLVTTITDGEPENKEPHKLREWRWFDPTSLPEPLMTPFANALRAGFDLTAPLDTPIISG